MNGAESLLKTLIDAGVEVCFSNPGTSEMQFVAAIDNCEGMQPVLALFEGVATGAADGYGRMAEKPAATLLHLGPGLANGMANLHNANRAGTPIVNIVGDHATYHLPFDAPLTSDVNGYSNLVSSWVRVSDSADDLAAAGAEAVVAAMEKAGQIATLIAPADHAWEESQGPAAVLPQPTLEQASDEVIQQAADALRSGEETAIFLGGKALLEPALTVAGRIAEATGVRLVCETFPARMQRGAGRVMVERLPYFGEMAADFLKDFKRIILVGSKSPVSFFAYPGKPSWLSPDDCETTNLAAPGMDVLTALEALAAALDVPAEPARIQPAAVPPIPEDGKLDPMGIGAVVANLMPEQAVVSDEAATCGLTLFPCTAGAAPHDWMMLTGGAIGQGLPLAVGAAVACPDRKVLALQADGSAMYTVQALWTMVREDLDITTVIINNGSYAILNIELQRVGVENAGPKALSMLDLTNPVIDWVSLAEGMGVPSTRATTVQEFHDQLRDAINHKGPRLIEAII
ncbi:acetolactate synthase large subunit [Aestuariicella hydrocarbonica]|uniref:Acetolactate synthase large subunit n=2 Tax=Pseudomaricurvus hydrocarbonicus TaxID=1470433 RepID=A0A9E5T3U9_9GAMM|nr:acetolactate synthase large subunit [Aestuariicella hydrocarbonica]NHO67473.1 acetolactate synthase large subunit [Aestuariicella hydrocarbonica]